MLTREMNDRLTRVGPGTPAGELMRRYWQPVAPCAELQGRAAIGIRILGEDLALYRDASGKVGLLADACPHRCAPLSYGIPERVGLRCVYHGWLFDSDGRCLEQPGESPNSRFKERINATAYPVREMGGFFWAYLGPGEPPLLPRHDYFVQDNTLRQIGKTELPCNWLQIMENSLDPVHSEWLHAYFTYYLRNGNSAADSGSFKHRRHAKFGFDLSEYGITKRRYYEGGSEEDNDWKIGHPVVFPNMLKISTNFQIRVPVDDENTIHYLYNAFSYPGVRAPEQEVVPVYEYPYLNDDGSFALDWVLQQDFMVWIKQGRIMDRTREHLGATDRGVILYRKVLDEMISRVEAGEDPLGVFRNPEDDVQINILIDEMVAPLTPTSMRSFARVQSSTDAVLRVDEPALDPEVIAKQMRQGSNLLMPVLEDWIKMRLEYLELSEAKAR